MNKFYLLFYALLISVIIALSACSPPSVEPLRLASNIWPGYEPLYLARDKHFLADNKISLIEFSSSAQSIQAFRNGLIDAAALTLDETLLLLESNEPVRIILVMDISNGADVVMAQQNIKDIADLRGKKIGVESNALGAYVVSRLLDIAKLEEDEVKIVNLAVDEHEKAFKQNQVDAVVTFEPVRSRLLNIGARQIFDSSQIPGEIVDVLVVRESYLEKHPENIQYLLNGWYKALALFKQKPQQAAKILGHRMKLNVAETLSSYQGLILPNKNQNKQLLSGTHAELKQTAKKLANLMLQKKLLRKQLNTELLFDSVKN